MQIFCSSQWNVKFSSLKQYKSLRHKVKCVAILLSAKQWCSKAFRNVNVVPPDIGAVHQVNLEYLSRVVQVSNGFIYPDSVVGTDSHTTMINGLGILGWGKNSINLHLIKCLVCVFLTAFKNIFCVCCFSSTRCWGNWIRSCDAGSTSVPDPSSSGGLQTGGLHQPPNHLHRHRPWYHKGNIALPTTDVV